MKCDECKIDYRAEILSPMVTSDGTTKPLCGICALEVTNRIHGIKRKRFTGEMAEQLRREAIKHRKKTKKE